MHIRRAFCLPASAAVVLFFAGSAAANPDPRGVWIDHTGRGAVEITDCDEGLCGKLVWLKDADNAQACGIQILGEVKPVGSGVWDKGWIYDPEQDAKYSVELKPMGEDQLRVMGYLGTKLLSETMVWKRAPADLERCSAEGTTAAVTPPPSGEGTPPVAQDGAKSPPTDTSALPESANRDRAAKAGTPPSKAEPETAQRKATGPRECTLRTPWVSLTFPCPD